jgi:hypothetical protein
VHPSALEKSRIEGKRHAHCRTPVARIGGALKEQSRRCNVGGTEKDVTASHESGGLVGG